MKRSIKAIASFIWLASLASCFSHSNKAIIFDQQKAGDAAFARGSYVEAERHYKDALVEAEKNGPEDQI